MKKSRSTKSPNASFGKKNTKKSANDPFAKPPNPLGFQFLADERPIRATKFAAILPSIIAKYGLGRKLGAERFQNAWRDALKTVFAEENAENFDGWNDENFGEYGSKEATFAQYSRPISFRGRALSVRIESNLLYQELQFYLPRLLKEIQAALPDEKIEKIKLVVR